MEVVKANFPHIVKPANLSVDEVRYREHTINHIVPRMNKKKDYLMFDRKADPVAFEHCVTMFEEKQQAQEEFAKRKSQKEQNEK